MIATNFTRNSIFLLINNLTFVDENTITDEDKKDNKMWIFTLFKNFLQQVNKNHSKNGSISNNELVIPLTGRCPTMKFVTIRPITTVLSVF